MSTSFINPMMRLVRLWARMLSLFYGDENELVSHEGNADLKPVDNRGQVVQSDARPSFERKASECLPVPELGSAPSHLSCA
jgi:hypothetical protein